MWSPSFSAEADVAAILFLQTSYKHLSLYAQLANGRGVYMHIFVNYPREAVRSRCCPKVTQKLKSSGFLSDSVSRSAVFQTFQATFLRIFSSMMRVVCGFRPSRSIGETRSRSSRGAGEGGRGKARSHYPKYFYRRRLALRTLVLQAVLSHSLLWNRRGRETLPRICPLTSLLLL